MTRTLVGHEMFDIQPISVSGQLHGEGIKSLRAQTTAAMLGVDVELVDHMVGSSATTLPDADKLPVGLGDDHQTRGHGCADVRLVPPPADLLIRGLRADQRRVVGSNVRLAERQMAATSSCSASRTAGSALDAIARSLSEPPDLALTRLGQHRHQGLSAERIRFRTLNKTIGRQGGSGIVTASGWATGTNSATASGAGRSRAVSSTTGGGFRSAARAAALER